MGSGTNEVDELRAQIDESRENLGEAVGALAYKADVKNRGKEAIEDKKEAIVDKVQTLKSKLPDADTVKEKLPSADAVKEKLPSADAVKEKLPSADAIKEKLPSGGAVKEKLPSGEAVGEKVGGIAHDHPLAVAAGAAGAGLAAGLAIPETKLERDKLGPAARDAREQVQQRAQELIGQAKSTAQDAIGQAKAIAQDAASSTVDAARQKGEQQDGKLGDVLEKAADKADDKLGGRSR